MNPELLRLSEVTLKGKSIQKLDLIATISVNGTPLLTVYRRYNNIHEIIVVDCQDDIYLQRDLPMVESIRRVLCLSSEQAERIRVADLFSFQHHGLPPTGHPCPLTMCWSDIQACWQGIAVDLANVWADVCVDVCADMDNAVTTLSIPSQSSQSSQSSDHQLIHLLRDIPSAIPRKRSWSQRRDGLGKI